QRNLVANEDITIATPSAAHEDDARFVSDGEKGVGDAGWAMDEVPPTQAELLAFDDGDTRAGENEKVFLVVELPMVFRTPLARLEHGKVVADLLKPTSVALERADVAHRLTGHPRQLADVCDERTIHTSSSRQEVAEQAGDQLRLAQGQIVVAVDLDEPRAGDATRGLAAGVRQLGRVVLRDHDERWHAHVHEHDRRALRRLRQLAGWRPQPKLAEDVLDTE